MLFKLSAVVFVVLSASPYTAPFRTYDAARDSTPAAVTTMEANDPGWLIAPVVAKASSAAIPGLTRGRVYPRPPVITAPLASLVCEQRDSIRPTVLRI
jgi:hypothetical protein